MFNLQCSPEQPTKAPNMAKGATVFGLGHESTAKRTDGNHCSSEKNRSRHVINPFNLHVASALQKERRALEETQQVLWI